MAYEVTATRRRPQKFENLAGQEFVAETLKNSIKSSQIAHAYLFAGPRGCGKTSTARILAKALNCQASSGPNPEPCGQCDSCRAITNSSSLDVYEIDGASNTSVNDVRQIKDEVMFPPSSSRYKIYIIDEVHMLSTSAFNALLKTIEEPPAHVIFIFATTELQKVPATIKSRCQQYNFRLVSIEKIKEMLAEAAQEMNIQADSEALYWIAKESGGSVRDSYTLFDQIVAFSDGHITYEKIRDKLGILGIEKLNEIFEKAASNDSEGTLSSIDTFLQSGNSIEQIISNSAEYLRNLLLIKSGVTKEALLGQSPERFSKKVLETWSPVQVERALSIFLQLFRDIRYSLSPRYELELAFSKMCWLSEYVAPSEVKAAIEKARGLLAGSSSAGSTAGSQVGNPASGNASGSAGKSSSFSQSAPSSAPSAGFNANPSMGQSQPNAQNQSFGQPQSSNQSQPSSQAQTPPPNGGMPHFAFFDKIKEDNQNPFHNGGALPPHQSAAPDFTDDSDYSSYDGSEYSYAPDDSPSEGDDYQGISYEESIQARVQEESIETTENTPLSSAGPDTHETSDVFTAPNGFSIGSGKIYGSLVAELSVQTPMLASALMKTKKWFVRGNVVSTSISTEYQKNYIEQNAAQIEQILSQICQSQMKFQISYEEEKTETKTEELPIQVKILCSAFKGSVVGGKI